MSTLLPQSLEKLVEELSRLPTIGKKTAQRLAFHIVRHSPPMAQNLAGALNEVGARVRACRQCGFLAEDELCCICTDPRRRTTTICVVEEPFDVVAFEKAGAYDGLYHVLQGRISPLHGLMPENLTIAQLLQRVAKAEPKVEEVILATSPTVDGDATALYVAEQLRARNCRITRIGVGVSIGSSLELTDELTLRHALERRQELD
ncbi:MAG: recombination mediator RecR [Candidatus Sumerlaeaceae bacterium]